MVVSALLVGAIVGSLGAGPAADALGPRRALLLNNVCFAAGSLLGAATPGGYWGAIAGASPGRCGACRVHRGTGRGGAEHLCAQRLPCKHTATAALLVEGAARAHPLPQLTILNPWEQTLHQSLAISLHSVQ